MTDGANLVHTIVDVAAGNYTNYGKKPTIKIVKQENLFYMKSGEIGLKLANGGKAESGLTANAKTLFKKQNVIMTISETTVTKRDNLFDDVIGLFEGNAIEYDFEYEEEYANVSRVILDIMILGS